MKQEYQPPLFEELERSDYVGHAFDGSTFNKERDGERLSKQLRAVRDYALAHDWIYLEDMARDLNYPATSIPALSARLRDLRKERFGSYEVQREYVKDGLWRYKVRAQ